jgi:SAM-dependent methyltransferase
MERDADTEPKGIDCREESKATSLRAIEAAFADKEYLRQRSSPIPGDPHYLCLIDLLLALKRIESTDRLIILDYGAGVSPYRYLFPNSEYRRADIGDLVKPDYLIKQDGSVPEESNVFDMVLSTQVLEHVDDPEAYLCECFRLLKPGGVLVLTTHGTFEDHGCPYDFRRWTADGLKLDLEKAGFEVTALNKLTSGPRAIMYLIERYFDTMSDPVKVLPRILHCTGKTVVGFLRRRMHLLLDHYGARYQVISSEVANYQSYISYIGLFACARRLCK